MSAIEKVKIDDSRFFLEKAKKKYLSQIYEIGIRKGDEIHYGVYDDATILLIRKASKENRGVKWGL